MGSITPLGERGRGRRWGRTVTAYVVGSALGGAAAGAAAGALGGMVQRAAPAGAGLLWFAAAAALTGAAVDAALAAAALPWKRLPGPRRQVNEEWLTRYRGWVYGAGFGVQLGLRRRHDRHDGGDLRAAGRRRAVRLAADRRASSASRSAWRGRSRCWPRGASARPRRCCAWTPGFAGGSPRRRGWRRSRRRPSASCWSARRSPGEARQAGHQRRPPARLGGPRLPARRPSPGAELPRPARRELRDAARRQLVRRPAGRRHGLERTRSSRSSSSTRRSPATRCSAKAACRSRCGSAT